MVRILGVAALFLLGPLGPTFGQSIETHDREAVGAEGKPGEDGKPDLEKAARLVVEQTNAFRKEQGREPVAVNEKLTATVTYFAGFMAKTGKYGHTADGSKPSDRATKHGYDYCIIAENIAYVFDPAGFTTEKLADQFFTGWKNSPHHRENMLDPDVTETAVAIARSDQTGYYYAVQMFGRPKSAAIEFKIANRSGETVEYTVADKTFSLPPRYTRTHERCRPAEVKFRWPGAKEPSAAVKPVKGDSFVVTKAGDEYRITKDPAK